MQKKDTLGARLISEKKGFCLNQLIFLLQTNLEEVSHCPKWSREKEKP